MNKVRKFYFPIHLNGGNRGCEGIAKGTAKILCEEKTQLIGLCTNPIFDKKLGIDKYVTLYPSRKLSIYDRVKRRICSVLYSKEQMIKYDYRLHYGKFLDCIKEQDVMLSTGGDMMCYVNNEVIYTNNKLHDRGVKTVLWGCSMGPENLTPEKEETLKNFSLVYARETLSLKFFQELGLNNVVCFPDPAFVLEPEEVHLPEIFSHGDVIGINLSNYVLGGFTLDTLFGKQVKQMIDTIIEKTQLKILLIPHVTWHDQDDRVVAQHIVELFATSNRVSVLDVDNLNYCQIRYVISKCKYFIGARTHAVISAYSTCVPTIALGYSIKSKGIAKDLGLPEILVVNCKEYNKKDTLLDSIQYLIDNESNIKTHLNEIMPDYCKRAYLMRPIINEL